MNDLKDWVTSIMRGWSFAFRVADALELHGPDGGKKGNLTISKTIQRLEKVSDSVGLKKDSDG